MNIGFAITFLSSITPEFKGMTDAEQTIEGKLSMNVSHLLKGLSTNPIDIPLLTSQTLSVVEPSDYTMDYSKKMYYHYLFEGSQDQNISLSRKISTEFVINNLRRKEIRKKLLPPFPPMLNKLLASLTDPTSSTGDYIAAIKRDKALHSTVLALCHRAYFNPAKVPIRSIDSIVVKLGVEGLRPVLSAALIHPLIHRNSPYYSQNGKKLWHHALCCAAICRAIAKQYGVPPYKAYLMGLLHDSGKTLLFDELCKQFALKDTQRDSPGYSAFAPPMKKLAPHLSYLIAKDWALPEAISIGIKEQVGISASQPISPYGYVLYQANLAAEAYVLTSRSDRESLNTLTSTLQLPKNLWTMLDAIVEKI